MAGDSTGLSGGYRNGRLGGLGLNVEDESLALTTYECTPDDIDNLDEGFSLCEVVFACLEGVVIGVRVNLLNTSIGATYELIDASTVNIDPKCIVGFGCGVLGKYDVYSIFGVAVFRHTEGLGDGGIEGRIELLSFDSDGRGFLGDTARIILGDYIVVARRYIIESDVCSVGLVDIICADFL